LDRLDALYTITGLIAYSWQQRLFREFLSGRIPDALDVPTGLGKTSIMGLWLTARALGAPVPRRLVYVVDRRAVVDQASREAERLADHLENAFRGEVPQAVVERWRENLGFARGRLPVSTLRGQFADNRLWLENPAGAAIVVGTVDMIGSRLLFQGYGVSARMRAGPATPANAPHFRNVCQWSICGETEQNCLACVPKRSDECPNRGNHR
jgi:CRISPR-associated endonuclease/helicase Cas3